MDKEDVLYVYKGILVSQKKKEWNNVICNNMDRPSNYHTKWSKPDRGRQRSHDIAYM